MMLGQYSVSPFIVGNLGQLLIDQLLQHVPDVL
jgi:hypothetical protein